MVDGRIGKDITEKGVIMLCDRPHEEVVEIGRLGGSVKSEKKTKASIIRQSRFAKCKNCEVDCIYKERRVQLNKDNICCCPDLRGRAIINGLPIIGLNMTSLDGHLNEFLDYLQNNIDRAEERLLEKDNEKRRHDVLFARNIMANKCLEIWDKITPLQIQLQSINLNIEGDTAERLLRKVMAARQIKQNGFVVIEEEKKEEIVEEMK